MKTSICQCGNTLYFENSQCIVCGRKLGFIREDMQLSALEPGGEGVWQSLANGRNYRLCANYAQYDICNWLVPEDEGKKYCSSCRLNRIIPNLSQDQNLKLWHRIEVAKRRLLYTLYSLGLPVVGRQGDPQQGLAFKFMQDQNRRDEFSNTLTGVNQVMTGHHKGIITINIREAEDSAREQMREQMNEGYRTLLGHFRHEIGHYYWERLIRNGGRLEAFRELFGDERENYQSALDNYYAQEPTSSWQDGFISGYASAHPWEDWAETWAHYLHMVDTLETANDIGFRIQNDPRAAWDNCGESDLSSVKGTNFDALMDDWTSLTIGLNALNRSMGLPDAYPFVLSAPVLKKLRFVHHLITGRSNFEF